MARYALSSSQLFFLFILFRAFSPIESVPMHYRQQDFTISPSEKTKYTFDLVSSDEYRILGPTFDVAASKLDFQVIGPPGEIVLYVRRTEISWDNRTTYTDSFIDQPRTRGTIGILFNCIFTLFLCVWTAFHTNIEPVREENKEDSWIRKRLNGLLHGNWRRKALWSVIIIMFPESSLFFALFERKKAKQMCALVDKACKRPEAPPDRWSKKPQLGYFALMGGFAIRDTRDGKDGRLMTLTPCGVYSVCRHLESADKLARIVADKNRASSLAKCLVLFQVIWMIIQIICRYNARLSVSLLETHTVIHGVCALIAYLIWFKKPFDVKHPIELESDDRIVEILWARDGRYYEAYKDLFDTEKGESLLLLPGPGGPGMTDDSHLEGKCMPLLTKRAGQTKFVWRVLIGDEKRFLSNLPNLIMEVYRQLVLVRLEFFIMLVASSVYGGLHVWALLDGHFPTPLEKFLWQLALYSIAGGLLGCGFVLLTSSCIPKSHSEQGVVCLVIKWLFVAICLAALILGVGARLYFFGESFAALRDPSAKAFRMISWTNLSVI